MCFEMATARIAIATVPNSRCGFANQLDQPLNHISRDAACKCSNASFLIAQPGCFGGNFRDLELESWLQRTVLVNYSASKLPIYSQLQY